MTVSDRPAAPAQPAGATAETVPSDGPRTLTEQVSESIQSSFRNASSHPADGNQVTVRLDPPELGKVLITFQQREGEIVGLLRVTQSQTRYEIEQTLPQVLRTLQDSGIGIRRLEVHLADQNEPQMDRDQLFQDGSFRQPDFAQNGHSGNDSPGQWMVANDAGDDIAEPHAYINDGAIDVLV